MRLHGQIATQSSRSNERERRGDDADDGDGARRMLCRLTNHEIESRRPRVPFVGRVGYFAQRNISPSNGSQLVRNSSDVKSWTWSRPSETRPSLKSRHIKQQVTHVALVSHGGPKFMTLFVKTIKKNDTSMEEDELDSVWRISLSLSLSR